MNHLLTVTEVYRVETVEDVHRLHEELKKDPMFTVTAYSYKTKYIKEKKEIIGEYQVVTVKKVFDEEKDPIRDIEIKYLIPSESGAF